MSLPTLLALTLLSSLAPPPRPQNSGRGRYVPPAASPAGRGGGGRSKGRYAPPSVDVTSAARKAREQRDLDLFGPPGEWRARKGQREWRNYKDEQQQKADDAGSDYDDGRGGSGRLATPAEFAPKMWRAEAGSGRSKGKTNWFSTNHSSFATLGASEPLQAALAALGADRPSNVQAAGFGPILSGADVALADQTGSGKTLAYLAPIAQALRDAEEKDGRTGNGLVRALVLTPTSSWLSRC